MKTWLLTFTQLNSFTSLAKAAVALPPAAQQGPLVNAAVGMSQMVLYKPGTDAALLRGATERVVGMLVATSWGATVSVEILPRLYARISVENIFIGGCFGGDTFTGAVQTADVNDRQMVGRPQTACPQPRPSTHSRTASALSHSNPIPTQELPPLPHPHTLHRHNLTHTLNPVSSGAWP